MLFAVKLSMAAVCVSKALSFANAEGAAAQCCMTNNTVDDSNSIHPEIHIKWDVFLQHHPKNAIIGLH